MNQLKILIADDDPTQLDHLQNLILGTHPDASDLINVTICDNKKDALNRIKGDCYDFLFCDLSFNDNDDPAKVDDDGLEIMTKAFERSTHTQIFLWSNKSNSDQAHEAVNILNNIPVSFKSLPKGITLTEERFKKRYFLESLKIWTKLVLTQAFQADKEGFLRAFISQNQSSSFIVNGEPRSVSYFTIYWSFLGAKPTLTDLLELAPEQVYDLPKVEPERLFGKPYSKFGSNLASYYVRLHDDYPSQIEKVIYKNATRYLNDLVVFYALKGGLHPLSIESTEDYPDSLIETCERISSANLTMTADLKPHHDSGAMNKFIKRLWCRLLVMGMYLYLKAPVTDCYYIIVYKKPIKKNSRSEVTHRKVTSPDDPEIFKYFVKFLWIYFLSKDSESYNRNLNKVFASLCKYEQEFLEKWWAKLKESRAENPEIEQFFATHNLEENYLEIHRS